MVEQSVFQLYLVSEFLPLALGPKSQKKFKKLMLHRIKWEEHNSKRDGRSDLSIQSLVPVCLCAYYRDSKPLIIDFY